VRRYLGCCLRTLDSVPCDPDLLAQAKAAEERLIDAEHATEVARADFHHAVRRLQLAGASLREIAVALGLSHQRVHQIVDAGGGSRRWRKADPDSGERRWCSFCGRSQRQIKTLVAGPEVYICNQCIPVVDAVLDTGNQASTATATIVPVTEQARRERCSFCGKRRHEVTAMASTGDHRICAGRIRLCRDCQEIGV
jgi:ClpX C4-type zinc finger